MDEGSRGYYSADAWFIITSMLALAFPHLLLLYNTTQPCVKCVRQCWYFRYISVIHLCLVIGAFPVSRSHNTTADMVECLGGGIRFALAYWGQMPSDHGETHLRKVYSLNLQSCSLNTDFANLNMNCVSPCGNIYICHYLHCCRQRTPVQ